MSHVVIVTGAAACFRRTEFATDLISYDAITPFAARGIYESIHWTPSIEWQIESIEILHPIRMEWSAVNAASGVPGQRVQTMHLIDVGYILHARFAMTANAGPADNPGRHADMFRRRLKSGRFFRAPYLGRRELIADVRPVDAELRPRSHYAATGAVDLGWMLHDRDRTADRRPRYFRPAMVNGVIDLRAVEPLALPG